MIHAWINDFGIICCTGCDWELILNGHGDGWICVNGCDVEWMPRGRAEKQATTLCPEALAWLRAWERNPPVKPRWPGRDGPPAHAGDGP